MILQDHVLVLNYKADWASELHAGLCECHLYHAASNIEKYIFFVTYLFWEMFSVSISEPMNTDIYFIYQLPLAQFIIL
jgi:hypothetical protein